MDQLQLYLNDQLADLSDNQPIALTFQVNNLADVKNQQGNTSNQFKLPLTQRNRQILGFPDDIAICTNLPHQKYQAKLVQDGLEIIPYGIAELNGIELDMANITILSGNVDFFDAIDGKLYDMGDSTSITSNYGQTLLWKQYDHVWNVDNVADSQLRTEGWIWPVVDYGAIDTVDFTKPIDVHYQRPGFFIKTAIEIMLQSSGYKGAGSLLADPLYPLMICQFSNGSFEHGTNYQNQQDIFGCTVSLAQDLNVQHPDTSGNVGTIIFPSVQSNPSGYYDAGTGIFTALQPLNISIKLTIPSFYLHGHFDNSYGSNVDIYAIYTDPVNGDTPLPGDVNFYLLNNPTFKKDPGPVVFGSSVTEKTTLTVETELPQNGKVRIVYEFKGFTKSAFSIQKDAVLTITTTNKKVLYGQTIQCERIFPDISQKELLKDTLQRFGIICQTDNASKTISFNSLRDIVNNIPVAKDWSGKVLDQGKQVAYQLGSYAQINYMQYQDDDNIPKKFGWSQITIADQTLPAGAELFTSPFAPTLNRPFTGGTISQIKTIDDNSDTKDFSINVSPRILIDHKTTLPKDKPVTFTDGNGHTRIVNDVISTPYFYRGNNSEPNLMFDNLRKKYYPELEKILTQTKKVVRYILLTPRDILELDLLIPVYIAQDSAYYYINKIDAWRKGQPTKVELVKLG